MRTAFFWINFIAAMLALFLLVLTAQEGLQYVGHMNIVLVKTTLPETPSLPGWKRYHFDFEAYYITCESGFLYYSVEHGRSIWHDGRNEFEAEYYLRSSNDLRWVEPTVGKLWWRLDLGSSRGQIPVFLVLVPWIAATVYFVTKRLNHIVACRTNKNLCTVCGYPCTTRVCSECGAVREE